MHIVRTKNRKTMNNYIQQQHLASLSNIADRHIIKARKERKERKENPQSIKYYTRHLKDYDNSELDRLEDEPKFLKKLDEFISKQKQNKKGNNSNDHNDSKIR